MTQESDRGRTFNTDVRKPWNPVIHNILKAIDNHSLQFLKTGEPWHEEKAEFLRRYISDLKEWIQSEEGR